MRGRSFMTNKAKEAHVDIERIFCQATNGLVNGGSAGLRFVDMRKASQSGAVERLAFRFALNGILSRPFPSGRWKLIAQRDLTSEAGDGNCKATRLDGIISSNWFKSF